MKCLIPYVQFVIGNYVVATQQENSVAAVILNLRDGKTTLCRSDRCLKRNCFDRAPSPPHFMQSMCDTQGDSYDLALISKWRGEKEKKNTWEKTEIDESLGSARKRETEK